MTPMYKNPEGYFEALLNGKHIVVPVAVFDAAIENNVKRRMEEFHEAEKPARDAAFFDLIEAAQWNKPEYWHTDTQPSEQAQAPATPDETAASEPGKAEPGPENETMWGPEGPEGWGFSVHFEFEGEDSILEHMAEYFYQLYVKAPKKSPQEARYALTYTSILRTLNQREIAIGVGQVCSHLADLVTTMNDISHELQQAMGHIAHAIEGIDARLITGTEELSRGMRAMESH